MRYVYVKNWEEFQHYKDRNPPWIKLHRSLLDDYEFCSLPDHAKGQLMLIWVFASQNGGKIPEDAKFIERKLGLSGKCDLDLLIRSGFLIPEQGASDMLATCKQGDSAVIALARSRETEKRTKATETECAREGFSEFWSAYPRKTARPEAEKAWNKLSPDEGLRGQIMSAVAVQSKSDQWRKDDGKFIPHPSTWLNQKRWLDQIPMAKASGDDIFGGAI